MRRKDKEITQLNEIEEILKEGIVCRLGLSTNNQPYIVPLSYGYSENCLYFHCAKEGKKLDMINENPRVCFEVEGDSELIIDKEGCHCTMKYKSVMGSGKAEIIEADAGKREALNIIMRQYMKKDQFTYKAEAVQAVKIIKVTIEEMTGKKSGY